MQAWALPASRERRLVSCTVIPPLWKLLSLRRLVLLECLVLRSRAWGAGNGFLVLMIRGMPWGRLLLSVISITFSLPAPDSFSFLLRGPWATRSRWTQVAWKTDATVSPLCPSSWLTALLLGPYCHLQRALPLFPHMSAHPPHLSPPHLKCGPAPLLLQGTCYQHAHTCPLSQGPFVGLF